jgi:hypothetical protein
MSLKFPSGPSTDDIVMLILSHQIRSWTASTDNFQFSCNIPFMPYNKYFLFTSTKYVTAFGIQFYEEGKFACIMRKLL